MLRHGIDKSVAGIGMALPARFQHVAQQEHPGKAKTVLQVLVRPAVLEPPPPSRRNAGSRSSRSRQGSPAARDTAPPDFGET
jgi:hypothetical protein